MTYESALDHLKKFQDARGRGVSKVPKGASEPFDTAHPGASENFRAIGKGASSESDQDQGHSPGTGKKSQRPRVAGIKSTKSPQGAEQDPVRCRDCRHFTPNPSNPSQGLGACAVESPDRMCWPSLKSPCSAFQISPTAVAEIAAQLLDDPVRFTGMVIADDIYHHPKQVQRLAEIIRCQGFPDSEV